MIVRRPTSIRIGGISYEMRAGTVVPAPVLTFWEATGELARLQTSGAVIDETAAPVSEPKPRARKSKDDAEPVRASES